MKKIISVLLLTACLLALLNGCSLLTAISGGEKDDEKIDIGDWNPFDEPQKPQDTTAPEQPAPETDAPGTAPVPTVTQAQETEAPSSEPQTPQPAGSTYEIFRENCTWEQARANCIAMGGHLVTINSAEEEAQIIRMAKDWGAKYIWIGGYTQKTASGSIIACWVTGEPMDYEDWLGPYEPTGEDIDGTPESSMMLWYIEKYGGYGWNDNRNDLSAFSAYNNKLYYICEFGDGMADINAR